MEMSDIRTTLERVAREYPAEFVAGQLQDVARMSFNIKLALEGGAKSICDIGGGIGLFSVGCSALGLSAMVVDDFGDSINTRLGATAFRVHEKYGVKVLSRDVIQDGLGDLDRSFDVVTSFDSMEHWHHSPKKLFRTVANALVRPGGRFVLGVPNSANLRKRLVVPFGGGSWSSMADWYEEEVFRGHVREPNVADLHYIARDMGLTAVRIVGRNWLGYFSRRRSLRVATVLLDYPLRMFPSLCSDLYMVGTVGARP